MTRLALRGDLLDFTDDPGFETTGGDGAPPGVRWRPDHWLLVDGGRIEAVQADPPGPDWPRREHPGQLILPGFIDTHVHCPQLDVIASYGADLLDWLERYTFPAETHFADPEVADRGAALFVRALFAHGTTAAVVFPTVHRVSTEALFAHGERAGMRLVTGKVLMDRNAPPALCDDVDGARRDVAALIARWHGRGRLSYAMTVRFAPTSTEAQLRMAGELLAAYPDLYLQTHVAENTREVQWVRELFPAARSYLDVYRGYGLLGPRSVLAHGIWFDDEDRTLLAGSGAQIAHCPTSNTFLGSGLFGWCAVEAAGGRVSVATDVGGGTSLSMLRTLAEAYRVQAMQGLRLTAWKALYAATRGAARALHLDGEIGALQPGHAADVVVHDVAVGDVARHRDALARGLHERVFAWMMLGDERNVVETYVAGRLQHERGAPAPSAVSAPRRPAA